MMTKLSKTRASKAVGSGDDIIEPEAYKVGDPLRWWVRPSDTTVNVWYLRCLLDAARLGEI